MLASPKFLLRVFWRKETLLETLIIICHSDRSERSERSGEISKDNVARRRGWAAPPLKYLF